MKLSTNSAMFVASYPMLQSVILRGIPLGNDRYFDSLLYPFICLHLFVFIIIILFFVVRS